MFDEIVIQLIERMFAHCGRRSRHYRKLTPMARSCARGRM